MPIKAEQLGDIYVVSVHDEEEPIHFHIPSVTPSRYEIPGINSPKEVFANCQFTFPDQKPIKYAHRRTMNNQPYVLIRIVDSKTFMYGTEQMKLDEYNQKLSPDVQRVPVPVELWRIANEIERQAGHMGLKAIKGEVTKEDLTDIVQKHTDFLRKSVADTNRLYKRSPMNVTPQSVRRAASLHKRGLLSPLPEWAQINPGAEGQVLDMMNCANCQKLIRKETIRCECGAIYNWEQAVNLGMVKPNDVPNSKRKEAGLLTDHVHVHEGTLSPDLPGPVAAPEDDAIESLA